MHEVGEVSDGSELPTVSVTAPAKGLAVWAATILIVGEIAGVGILALPDASVKAGFISFALLPFFCILSAYTAHLLCECWSLVRRAYPEYNTHVPNPYPIIGLLSFGKWGKFVVTTSINLTLFGASVVFIVLAAQLIDGIFTSYNITAISFCLWMIIITVGLIPLSWYGTPKDFWWIAVFAMVATALACVFVITNSIRAAPLVADSAKQQSATNLQDFFLALGTIMFAFSGHPGFPTIAIDMKHPERFTKSSIAAYCIVFCMYLPVVILTYIVFGAAVSDNIVNTLNDYLKGDGINTAIQALIFVHVVSAFTIVINPVLQHAEELFHIPNSFSWKRLLVRTSLVLLALFIAESIPRFGVLVSLVGSSTNAMLVYVIPCACYLRLKHKLSHIERAPLNAEMEVDDQLSKPVELWQKVLQYIIIIIGLFGVISGTVTSIMNIVGENTFVPPCYINFQQRP